MQLEEIQHSIELRRNRIFLLMEEVRRLRIQQRVKVALADTTTTVCLHCCQLNILFMEGLAPGNLWQVCT